MVDVACWREGLNRCVDPATMQEEHTKLVQAELDQHHVSLMRIEGAMGLVCNNPFKEGQPICPLSAMDFDNLVALTGFLSEGGNRILQDRIIKVNGMARGGL